MLTSSAVHKWGTEIHEGIYNMLMLLVELVAERVKQDPVPVNLMGVLTMVRRVTLLLGILCRQWSGLVILAFFFSLSHLDFYQY